MPHACEDCGETFDTLSCLRLHDCPEDEEAVERERRKQDEEFDWDTDVHDRLRSVVEDCGLAQQLPDEWTFADIVI